MDEFDKNDKSGYKRENDGDYIIRPEDPVPAAENDEEENAGYKPKPAFGNENVYQKADAVVTLEYTDKVCFVLQQNSAEILKSLSVLNNTQNGMKDVRLKVASSPRFFEDAYFSAASLAAGEEHYFKDIKTALDYEYLSTLQERVKTDITVETEINGIFLKKDVYKLDVLAYDEWPGYGTLPEYLASFCTPKDPAVTAVVGEAAQLLKKDGLSFNAYQSSDPNVVNKQLAAIYSVIKAKNIAYSMPPASFETQGQKIRLPQSIMDGGLGTCLDTTMFFCSCAEAAGINPVVFLFSGHALPGFWLTDSTFPERIGDDLSSANKNMAAGMSRLTVLESTLLTDNKSSYESAVGNAKARLEKGAGFILYLDIARARKAGILPLPVRYGNDGSYRVDRELYAAEKQELERLRVVSEELESKSLGGRLEKWKRDLLDITLRNPLLNYKILKSGVPLLTCGLEETENALADGLQLQILPQPKEIAKTVTDIIKLNAENDAQLLQILKNELEGNRLRSSLGEEELTKRLTGLFRSSRLSLEETGASPLYIALGFLKWAEKDKPNTDRYAPVILIPVELTRRSARAGYTVRMAEEEVQVNLSLLEMLRINFKIDASGLENLPAGEKGLDMRLILTHLRKLIIDQKGWDVIEAAALGLFHFSGFVLWNDLAVREKKLLAHPLTSSLITARNDPRLYEPAFGADGDPNLYMPLDSDSSQTLAARDAAAGKTFVLHGPPGTGKSQTITNIISNALAHGKKVLFVAEKLVALNVVKKRLEKLGLFDFCLELHSNKGQKKNFYEQFDKTLELADNAKDVRFADAANKLSDAAGELEAFASAMNRERKTGVSVFDAVNKVIAAGELQQELINVGQTDITGKQYAEGVDALQSLTAIGAALGEPVNSAFYRCRVTGYSFSLRDTVLRLSKDTAAGYQSFSAAVSRVNEIVKRPKRNYDFTRFEIVNGLYETFKSALYYSTQNGFARFIAGIFSSRHRSMRKSPFYTKLKKFIKTDAEEAAALFAAIDNFITAERALKETLKYGAAYENTDDWGLDIYSAAEQFAASSPSLKDACIYNEHLEKCSEYPQLAEIAAAYHGGCVAGAGAVTLFEKSFWQTWTMATVTADPVLNGFSPSEFASKRERFKAFTEFVAGLTQKEIYLKMAANLPNFKYASISSAEPGILLKAVKNRGRGLTIRQLFAKIPELILNVKPCMLMSPLSAAQYLPPDFPLDIVIFDEASQLLTCEAAGAVSRGKSAVVVGDPNQLPPTTFFRAQQSAEETDFEMQDLESILDDMLALNVPQNKLLWHYRSEHESLIAFSNANYYDNKLITFPSVDDARSRVVFRKVDGVYDRGSARTNPKEAEAVVDELFVSLRDPERSKLSYGIVTFNVTQQSLIEDLVDKRLAKEPELEKFFSAVENPVFIKNIESVQGDERDVIIFSVTYGVDKEGKMTVNFGPVNKDGGWRRLNVAITRACKKIIVFSTITPDMIDASRTSSKGVKGLKDFMSFAINPAAYFKRMPAGAAQTPFAAELAEKLKERGFNVKTGIGRSANKMDAAVCGDDGKYLLGIICDDGGAAMNADVRDREYGRENILKRMGWKIARAYALEWWQNSAAEIKRISNILNGEADDANAGGGAREEIEKSRVEIAFNPNIALPQKEYIQTRFDSRRSQDEFYAYNNAAAATACIKKIVETEGPISEQELCRKLAEAWNVQRMTQKFNEYAAQYIRRAGPVSNTTQNKKFFWRAPEDIDMQYFRSNAEAGRKPEEICKEEFAAAAYYIMRNALSIGAEDLIRETARLFGFTKTPAAAMRIGYALSLLTAQGKIIKDGETYRLK